MALFWGSELSNFGAWNLGRIAVLWNSRDYPATFGLLKIWRRPRFLPIKTGEKVHFSTKKSTTNFGLPFCFFLFPLFSSKWLKYAVFALQKAKKVGRKQGLRAKRFFRLRKMVVPDLLPVDYRSVSGLWTWSVRGVSRRVSPKTGVSEGVCLRARRAWLRSVRTPFGYSGHNSGHSGARVPKGLGDTRGTLPHTPPFFGTLVPVTLRAQETLGKPLTSTLLLSTFVFRSGGSHSVFSGDFPGRVCCHWPRRKGSGARFEGMKMARGAPPGTKNQGGHVNSGL